MTVTATKEWTVAMLTLSRKPNERIFIGDSVIVTVIRIDGQAVRLGITAPDDVPILREELLDRPGWQERDGEGGRR